MALKRTMWCLLVAIGCATPSAAPKPSAPPSIQLVMVGTGDWGSDDGKIFGYRFDPRTGEMTKTASIATGGIAAFFAFDPERPIVHVADEGAARVLSFTIEDESGRLKKIGERPARGHPVYITMSKSRSHLLAASYNGGSTEVFAVGSNGAVDDATDRVMSGAQSHAVRLSPDGRYALVPAKQANHVAQYRFEDGRLVENSTPIPAKADAGPRHMAWHPSGQRVYVTNELDTTVDVFAYDPSKGTLAHESSVSAIPEGVTAHTKHADIHVHPNGRFVYTSVRVADAVGHIAVFRVDGARLELVEHVSTQGTTPRNFTLSPDGSHLLVGNRTSSSIAVFTVDATTGRLGFVRTVELGGPPFFVGFAPR